MAPLAEAFVLGTAPPALPVSRLASKPRWAMHNAEPGVGSALSAAAAVVAGLAAKRRMTDMRAAVATRASPPEETNSVAEAKASQDSLESSAPDAGQGALSQRLRQRLASTIAEQESQVEAVPSEEQKRIVQQEVDLNGIDPVACFLGAAPVAALSYGFWTFTSRSAEWFYNHPVESDFYPVQRLGLVFQAAVVGLSSLAAGIFGFTALGILLLGVRVSFGVMSGELDPADKSKGIGKRSTAETVLDVFTKDPVEVVKAEKERKLQAERKKDAA
ncbi:SLC2A3 [Symbiodinium natans]|uniref:SLC2A3 protein n=1 Tax=Symbiodinium natans TaxID=878477 RepID=A0A812IC06_9DINO|nr:SLC2A3 [Symbiodinium natans]